MHDISGTSLSTEIRPENNSDSSNNEIVSDSSGTATPVPTSPSESGTDTATVSQSSGEEPSHKIQLVLCRWHEM